MSWNIKSLYILNPFGHRKIAFFQIVRHTLLKDGFYLFHVESYELATSKDE